MSNTWATSKIGDIAKVTYGYTAKASFDKVGPRFLRITDITENQTVDWDSVPYCKITEKDHQKHRLNDGDIVFARTGATTGKSHLVANPPNSVCASYLIRLSINNTSIIPEYLIRYFQTKEYWDVINGGIAGSAQGGFNASKLSNLIVPFPPLSEQKRIVSILDEAFTGIDQAIANTEKNLTNARELFESYLNNHLHEVATSEFKHTLSELTELIVDCEHKTAPTQETGYPSIRTPNIGKGYLKLEGVRRVSKETYDIWTKRAIPKAGDLILAREAPAGNIAIVPKGEKVCLGQRTVLIRPKTDIVSPKFLSYLILHPITQKRLLSHSTGATVQHVNMKDIRKLPIGSLPSIEEQNNAVNALETANQKFVFLESIYQQKLDSLQELKQSILQKAFTGELTKDYIQEQVN